MMYYVRVLANPLGKIKKYYATTKMRLLQDLNLATS